jgi:hypothetical protein
MTSLSENSEKNNALRRRIEIFFKRFKINGILRKVRATKTKGFPVYMLFMFLFELVFIKKEPLSVSSHKPKGRAIREGCDIPVT